MAVALDSSPASSGRQPGILLTISDTCLGGLRRGRSRSARRSRSGGRGRRAPWPAGGGRRRRPGSRGTRRLHVRGHRAPGRDERLELVADPHQRVGHARSRPCPRALGACSCGRGRRRVPRRGDDDEVGLGGAVVVAGVDGELAVGPPAPGCRRGPPSPGSVEREPSTTSKPTDASRAPSAVPAGPVPPEDADAHGRSLAHTSAARPTSGPLPGTPGGPRYAPARWVCSTASAS